MLQWLGRSEGAVGRLDYLLNVSENKLDKLILQARSWTRYQEIAAQMAAKPPLKPYELQWFDMLAVCWSSLSKVGCRVSAGCLLPVELFDQDLDMDFDFDQSCVSLCLRIDFASQLDGSSDRRRVV